LVFGWGNGGSRVGVLDGFLMTWSNARNTFGQGTLPTGRQYDKSAQLRQMQAILQSAAPGSAWSGNAATAYDAANTAHGKVFDRMAGLDRRLSAHVTQSARVVDTGRTNLDAVRTWVLDAAASVPAGKNHEQMLIPIVQKGLGQLHQIVTKANADLSSIGAQVRAMDGEYRELGDQRFAPTDDGLSHSSDGTSPAELKAPAVEPAVPDWPDAAR
jgi:hypothetical protein